MKILDHIQKFLRKATERHEWSNDDTFRDFIACFTSTLLIVHHDLFARKICTISACNGAIDHYHRADRVAQAPAEEKHHKTQSALIYFN